MKIKRNIGKIDRKIRMFFGIFIIFTSLLINSYYKWILTVVGSLLIITSLTGFCGIYALFRINTCKFDEKKYN